MASFKVLAQEFTYKGKTYKAGQFVQSATDLSKVFFGLFAKVESVSTPAPEAKPPTETPETPTQPVSAPTTPPEPVVEAESALTEAVAPVVAPVVHPPKGRDVTKNFKRAVDEDYLVYKTTAGYTVYDKDDPSKPLNEEPIQKAAVDRFILKQISGR